MNDLHERIATFLGWSPTSTTRFSLQSLRDIVRFANLPEGMAEKHRHELVGEIEHAIRSGAYVKGEKR